MLISTADIVQWVGIYIWPLFRVAALVATAPVIGVRFIPNRIKLVFILAVTYFLVPHIPSTEIIDPISILGIVTAIQQVIIGLAMAFAMNLVFSVFVLGGQIVAVKMGLGFASMVDPQMGTQVPVISQFYITIVSLVFLSINGHIMLIEVLLQSFIIIPVSTQGLETNGLWILITWFSFMFKGAVVLALPAIATLMIVNIALGVVMRASPQFNIMSIGFPITLSIGFMIILVTLPILIPHILQYIEEGFSLIDSFLRA